MSNHKNLTTVPASRRYDRTVTWAEGMKPLANPHTRGTVFLSTGRQTVVTWEDGSRSVVFTGALVLA